MFRAATHYSRNFCALALGRLGAAYVRHSRWAVNNPLIFAGEMALVGLATAAPIVIPTIINIRRFEAEMREKQALKRAACPEAKGEWQGERPGEYLSGSCFCPRIERFIDPKTERCDSMKTMIDETDWAVSRIDPLLESLSRREKQDQPKELPAIKAKVESLRETRKKLKESDPVTPEAEALVVESYKQLDQLHRLSKR